MKEKIIEVLESVYGKSIYNPVLAEDLEKKIPAWLAEERDKTKTVTVEEKIRLRCWDFFSGGDTAGFVATLIMELYEMEAS